ncbi:MAG: Hg(II)-responsive transcriptional regulator [Sulfuriferula sp.]
MHHRDMTIGMLARQAGVNLETIRYYQRRGLLIEPAKPLGGIRRYTDIDMTRIKFIKRAQHLGFTLEEVGALLKLEDGTHCTEARSIAVEKLADVKKRLEGLRGIELSLQKLVSECATQKGDVTCPLIASLLES